MQKSVEKQMQAERLKLTDCNVAHSKHRSHSMVGYTDLLKKRI